MASLFITYWSGSDRNAGRTPGNAVASEVRAITSTSAQSGVTPEGCRLISIFADAAGCFEYNANPTAASASSPAIGINERLWIDAKPGWKIAGKT